MSFKPGQIFNVNDGELCLLDLINYNNKTYGLFSLENDKISYMFYQIVDNGTGYDLLLVEEESLNNYLLSIYEEREGNDEG